MISLGAPSPIEDDKYLLKICKEPPWSAHYNLWSWCYYAYRHHGGNPWSINKSQFPQAIGDEQRQLYENRKSVKRFNDLRNQQLPSCPMCGSPGTGTLDHFLPKETFPEFSVMAANLVPACTHCNSSAKGRKYQGASSDEWPLHPYFDTLAKSAIWQVRVNPLYQAATFDAVPYLTHPPAVLKRLAFHLDFVLGSQFQRACASLWATLPQVISDLTAIGGPIAVSDVHSGLTTLLRIDQISMGANAWRTAFHRGLLGEPSAQGYVASEASKLAKSYSIAYAQSIKIEAETTMLRDRQNAALAQKRSSWDSVNKMPDRPLRLAHPPEQPALDHEHRPLDLRLVPWASRSGRQMPVS